MVCLDSAAIECGFHVSKMGFSSSVIMLGFGKSSHIITLYAYVAIVMQAWSQL